MPDVMAMNVGSIGPGLTEPVGDSQAVFRLVLDCLARPGSIGELSAEIHLSSGLALSEAALAVGLTLLDFETPFWVDTAARQIAPFFRFHCNAPLAARPEEARFAFARDLAALPPMAEFNLGSADYPDRSTTIVLDVAGLEAGRGLTLRGPGIQSAARLNVRGVPEAFWAERAALMPLFPLGIDLILTCGRRVAALPRTTIVEA